MPASTDIYGQLQQLRPVNRLADLAQVMQVQGLQQQGELGQMKMDALRRETEQENALSSVYAESLGSDGKVDRNRLLTLLGQRNLGAKIPAIQKTFAEQDKAATDADQAKFKLATERHDFYKKTLGALAQEPNLSPDLVVQAGQSLVQQGILPATMLDQALTSMPKDPAQLRAWLNQGIKAQLTPEQMLTVFAPKPTEITNGQQKFFRDTNPNSPTFGQTVGGAPVQMQMTPGEVAADRRASAQLAETKRHHGVTESQGAFEYKQDADGNFIALPKRPGAGPIVAAPVLGTDGKPVGAGGKGNNASEGERKAATLLQRLEGSQRQLLAALQANPDAAKPELLASGLRALGAEAAANTVTGTQRQQVDAAQLDILDAALTLGTGAAYTREQLEGYRKSYFPQIGDDAATVADKEARLNNVIQAAKIAAGRAARPNSQAPAAAATPAPRAGAGGLSAEEQKELDALRARFGKGK